jgi:hypothetical protein
MYLDEILIMFGGLHLGVNVMVFVCKAAKEEGSVRWNLV